MANCQKFTRSATGHMCAHFERQRDENGEYVKFHNQNIDLSKTHLNYNLAPDHGQIDFIRQRISEVKCLKRADVNVMCSWVVTVPKDLPQERHKEFFQATYNFLSEKYGEQNVISSYVHLDEVTPHMHFAFVPVYHDKSKNIDKVSAFKIITKGELNSFHPKLNKYLEKALNCPVNVLNGSTVNGNRTVEELKAEYQIGKIKADTAEKSAYYKGKAKQLKDDFEFYYRKRRELKIDIAKSENQFNQLASDIYDEEEKIKDLQLEKKLLQQSIENLEEHYQVLQNNPPKEKVVEVQKIVEIPKIVEVKKEVKIEKIVEVPVEKEVIKEVNLDYKGQAEKAIDLVWRFSDWIAKMGLLKKLSESDPKLDNDSIAFCRELRGLFHGKQK